MAMTAGYDVHYRCQGVSLRCWLIALEMLMDWLLAGNRPVQSFALVVDS